MPFSVRKRSGPRPYKVLQQLPGGRTRQVGSSSSRKKAKMSAGIAASNERQGKAP